MFISLEKIDINNDESGDKIMYCFVMFLLNSILKFQSDHQTAKEFVNIIADAEKGYQV